MGTVVLVSRIAERIFSVDGLGLHSSIIPEQYCSLTVGNFD